MFGLNIKILNQIFSFYSKYIYLIIFFLILFFTFTDLYLKQLTERQSQLKKIHLNFNLSSNEIYEQFYKVSYYNLVRRIYTNLLEDKIRTDYNEIYKNNEIITEKGFSNVDFKEIPVDVVTVQLSIIKKISQGIFDDYFLNNHTRFEYKIDDLNISDKYNIPFYLELKSKYNLEEDIKIKEVLYKSLLESMEMSFSSIYNELFVFSGYTNFLTVKEIENNKNPRFIQIISEQNQNLNKSYEDAKVALKYLSNPTNYMSIEIENYQGKVPSFFLTLIFSFFVFNFIIIVLAYIYFYIKSES